MNEAEWSDRVKGYALLMGWMVSHARPCRTEKGWRTALEGHPGAPDWLFARDGYVLNVELKSDTGKLRKGQPEWASALGDSYRCWRPRDWPLVQEELKR